MDVILKGCGFSEVSVMTVDSEYLFNNESC